MANAIGETRAVARQGSGKHDEMDGWPGGWMDSGRGKSQDSTYMLRHCTDYLNWQTETELGGLGSVLGLAPSHKGKSRGGHALTWTVKHSTRKAWH